MRRQHPPHLERLGIYRTGFRSLPILPPKCVWMVSGMRHVPKLWRFTRAEMAKRALFKFRADGKKG